MTWEYKAVDGIRYGYMGILAQYRETGYAKTYRGEAAHPWRFVVDTNGFPQVFKNKAAALCGAKRATQPAALIEAQRP